MMRFPDGTGDHESRMAPERGSPLGRWRSPAALLAGMLAGLLVSAVALVASDDGGSDWPQWRGAAGTGWTEQTDLPVSWSPEENVVWRLVLPGASGATPIISDGRVFLNVGVGDDLELWSVGFERGDVLWKRRLGPGNHKTRKQDMSTPSPVANGRLIVALTGTGVLAAFDFQGKGLWRRDLQEEYGAFGLNWGYASSPLLVGDTVFVQVLHGMKTDDPSYLLAVDAASGTTKWRVERATDALAESPDSYSTPVLFEAEGQRMLIITGGDYVTAHDLTSGRELWRRGGLNPDRAGMYRIVASALATPPFLVVPSRLSPLLTFRPTMQGAELAWSLDRGTDVPTPCTDGRRLFVVNDRGILRAFELATGRELFEPFRLPAGTYSASPLLSGSRLYVSNEGGTTAVVDVAGEPKLLAENKIDEYTLSSLAVSGRSLLLRTANALYRIEATAPPAN